MRRSAFAPAFWLGVSCVLTKAVHWSRPEASLSAVRTWLLDVGVSAHADVLFAACVGVLGAALLRATARAPRVQAALFAAYLAFCCVCVIFSVASIQIFAFLRSPLTRALLYLADDFGNMRSSLGAFLSWPVTIALIVAPIVWTMLSLRALRRAAAARRLFRLAPALWTAVAVCWFAWGRFEYEGRWHDRDDHLIARSPHAALIASYATEFLGMGTAEKFEQDYPKEYLEDFRPLRPGESVPSSFTAEKRPKNVILVVLESTGAQHFGLHGGRYDTTPNLVAEAPHALVYDRFYCHVGLTANSVAAITLSLYPYMTWREYTVEYPDMPGESLAAVLKRAGYRTGFLHSGDLAYVNQRAFLDHRGFDTLWDWRDLGAPQLTSWATHDQALFDGVLRWISEEPERPFFAQVWTHQSHHPYEPMPGVPLIDFFQDGKLPIDDYDLGRYLNTIHFVDAQLGRLFAALRERGMADDTLVVVTGDHGEAFGDPHSAWGHGSRVYDENVRVPMMIWNPRLFPGGGRPDMVGGHVDVNATIADIVGVPPSTTWRGRSLFAKRRSGRAYFYAANDDYLLGVREGQWKFIYNATRGRDELYDLVADPQEQRNLAKAHPDECKRFRQRLAAWRDDTGKHLEQIRASRVAK